MPNTADQYVARFQMHRGALVDLLRSVPADKADFAPWEGAMSFHKMADHMSGADGFFASLMKGTERVKPEPTASYAAALERLEATTQNALQMLGAMSPEQLGTMVTAMGGRTMPVGSLVDYMIEHDAHHKGQVFTMMRMAGLEVPKSWVKLG